MFPEDRVLVGVINRRKDFEIVQQQGWYRIPVARAPRVLDGEYLAFFFSQAFKTQNGAIHHYARRTGIELARRRDLLPAEPQHARADELYYKITLGPLQDKQPPITNPQARSVAFIQTTWDRFSAAKTLVDLYSSADIYVDRVTRALERREIKVGALWQDDDLRRQTSALRQKLEKLAAQLPASDLDSADSASVQQIFEALGPWQFLQPPPRG